MSCTTIGRQRRHRHAGRCRLGGIEHGQIAGHQILGAKNARPTAVFAANYNLALGVMAAAHQHDVKVGDELALVGYNDIPLAQLLPVPLTSVRTPFDQIAATAIDLMLQRKAYRDTILRALPTLIPRQSSGKPKA